MAAPVPEAYADCLHLYCHTCQAAAGDYCINPITDRHRATPCWTRIHDAEVDQALESER